MFFSFYVGLQTTYDYKIMTGAFVREPVRRGIVLSLITIARRKCLINMGGLTTNGSKDEFTMYHTVN